MTLSSPLKDQIPLGLDVFYLIDSLSDAYFINGFSSLEVDELNVAYIVITQDDDVLLMVKQDLVHITNMFIFVDLQSSDKLITTKIPDLQTSFISIQTDQILPSIEFKEGFDGVTLVFDTTLLKTIFIDAEDVNILAKAAHGNRFDGGEISHCINISVLEELFGIY
eukprot:CAMPEP_0114598872 /NCGR_PEP_ID=MMETSP0125-20121206/21288_1 /TAXON_ID=485358 ORGANISM="Aristerostoma sp., Strain ATCC 50986" /NCGR_SAMPLE_ID=MMETSP0125 /ASSEMBLY_ACC=CAM_ASM_000245 /LENGTH=165 /DNA_ID=CAMNT_0001805129 /DNA_START=618 /DNA_END=1114 /DNA_ORIENTATION=-